MSMRTKAIETILSYLQLIACSVRLIDNNKHHTRLIHVYCPLCMKINFLSFCWEHINGKPALDRSRRNRIALARQNTGSALPFFARHSYKRRRPHTRAHTYPYERMHTLYPYEHLRRTWAMRSKNNPSRQKPPISFEFNPSEFLGRSVARAIEHA
jgi:hypothetical protein